MNYELRTRISQQLVFQQNTGTDSKRIAQMLKSGRSARDVEAFTHDLARAFGGLEPPLLSLLKLGVFLSPPEEKVASVKLTPESYFEYFSTLLFAEEIQMSLDIREFDLHDVKLKLPANPKWRRSAKDELASGSKMLQLSGTISLVS